MPFLKASLFRTVWLGTIVLLALAVRTSAGLAASADEVYPTDTRVDYVFGCMAANGETQDMLERCSCSIDVIASILTYERYVQAETVLRMRGLTGDRGAEFKDNPVTQRMVDDLRQAQVEADFRCF